MRIICLLVLLGAVVNSSAQSYKRIHSHAFIADTHNDVLMRSMEGFQIDTDLHGQTHTDIGRLIQANYGAQMFSVFFDERYGKDSAFRFAIQDIDSLYTIVARNASRMMMVRNKPELKLARESQKLAALIGVEGGHLIEDRIEYLDSLYNRGARYLTLTWNNSTSWATSGADETANKLPYGHKGLSDFGKSIVRHMNQLGMMVDISHVGEQTFWDAVQVSTKPLIASHSSVYTLCPVSRNLKDDQIRAIAKSGGVVFINFYSGFLDSTYLLKDEAFQKLHASETDSLVALRWTEFEINSYLAKKYKQETELFRPELSILIDHIDYIRQLVGADYVGLGSDFDGINSAPKGLDDVTDIWKITKALVDRGYSRKDIRKILGGNFVRVFNAICKE